MNSINCLKKGQSLIYRSYYGLFFCGGGLKIVIFFSLFALLGFDSRESQSTSDKKHVLILEGGGNQRSHALRYYYQSRSAYDYYIESGVSPQNIKILGGAPGTEWSLNDFSSTDLGVHQSAFPEFDPHMPPKTGGASKEKLKVVLEELANSAKKNGGDVEIFIHDHGYNDYLESLPQGELPQEVMENTGIHLWGEKLSAQEFSDLMVETFGNSGVQLRLYGAQCFSGILNEVSIRISEMAVQNQEASNFHMCSLASTSMWTSANALGMNASTFSYYNTQSVSLKKGEEKSFFETGLDLNGADAQNIGRGRLSSLSYIHKVLKTGDYNPQSSEFSQLLGIPDEHESYLRTLRMAMEFRDIREQRLKRHEERDRRTDQRPSKSTDNAGSVTRTLRSLTSASSTQPKSNEESQLFNECVDKNGRMLSDMIPENLLNFFLTEFPEATKYPDISLEDLEDIPGLNQEQKKYLQRLCDNTNQRMKDANYDTLVNPLTNLLAEADEFRKEVRVTDFSEGDRAKWLDFQARSQRILDKPEVINFRRDFSTLGICSDLDQFLAVADENEKKVLGRLLSCELE